MTAGGQQVIMREVEAPLRTCFDAVMVGQVFFRVRLPKLEDYAACIRQH